MLKMIVLKFLWVVQNTVLANPNDFLLCTVVDLQAVQPLTSSSCLRVHLSGFRCVFVRLSGSSEREATEDRCV